MDAGEVLATDSVEETSRAFLTAWTRLISTTNWEKGRIIAEWRQALVDAEAPAQEYSDDAWSQHVGGVSPQHVGRLRRVCERFASVRDTYPGLYWSHFQIALDWSDAEMWLEGAVHNAWSVAEMRRQRATVTGGVVESPEEAADEHADEDLDGESAALASTVAPEIPGAHERLGGNTAKSAGDADAPFDGDESDDDESAGDRAAFQEQWDGDGSDEGRAAPVRPFAALPEMPDDLADAFESFKLAILRHKAGNWSEISRDDALRVLDALRELALAPAE